LTARAYQQSLIFYNYKSSDFFLLWGKMLAGLFGVSQEDIRSHESIIINFLNSPQSNGAVGVNNGEVKNHNEQLVQQLAIKDKQIEELMAQNRLLAGALGR
jgi:hypothetical protein